ncbi:hypothetical protein LOZ12_003607 [Ophidiomyces ophidiicola]|nr:hypothetical protein LOZ62_006062 [Ophidiomyces ophidiicola]KAI1948297.1 hypothetical protein LOZ59_006364 [Ophidiomyces ophidiicola]KAI1966337.1 hypothetical protein LOZ56_005840 [Ophidiomyces ophidiicola]KAI2000114.1 hypothetical protein LOZ50_006211 [Ophidiomyces ophidiicola]KAI2022317.1 hypothetical protein LOZ45_004388 [Ophidiomyces ophidiicola]
MIQKQQPLRIRILAVPDCPLVPRVQDLVDQCLTQTHIQTAVETTIGDYSSPTLLINDFDVTGRTASIRQISCRLDLPKPEEIIAALRVIPILDCHDPHEKLILANAFQAILATGRRVSISDICTSTKLDEQTALQRIASMRNAGFLKLDSDGHIAAAAGLSTTPTKHQITLRGQKLWTWCPLDIIGIFGALDASGSGTACVPGTKEMIQLSFEDGRAREIDGAMLFLVDTSTAASLCSDWCPNIGLFPSKSAGESWMQENVIQGDLISVASTFNVAQEVWRRILRG